MLSSPQFKPVKNLPQSSFIKTLLLQNLYGKNLPEQYISLECDDIKRLPEKLKMRFELLFKLISRISGSNIDVVSKEVVETFQPLLMQVSEKHHKTQTNTQAHAFLKTLTGTLNLFEAKLSELKSKNHLDVIMSLCAMFEKLSHAIECAGLEKSVLHDMVLGSLVRYQFLAADQLVAIGYRDVTVEELKLQRELVLASLQNLELLSSYGNTSLCSRRKTTYQTSLDILLVDAEVKLGYVKIAGKRLEKLYTDLWRKQWVCYAFVNTLMIYVQKISALDQDINANVQAQLLWLNRILKLFSDKQLVISGREMSPSEAKDQVKVIKERIQLLKSFFSGVVRRDFTRKVGSEMAYIADDDTMTIRLNTSKKSSFKGLGKLVGSHLNGQCSFTFKNNIITVKNLSSMPCKKFTTMIDHVLPALVDDSKALIERRKMQAVEKAKKAAKKQLLLRKREDKAKAIEQAVDDHSIVLASNSVEESRLNLKQSKRQPSKPQQQDELAIMQHLIEAVDSLHVSSPLSNKPADANSNEPIVHNTSNTKQKIKRKKTSHTERKESQLEQEKPAKTKWYSAKKLKLKSSELIESGVKFLKLNGALGIYVGFNRRFDLKSGKAPSTEIIERFRKTLCKVPTKVSGVNKTGFKHTCCPGEKAPLLIGKHKSLPWRLLPQCKEVTDEGKTVILYGTLKNTKKGKKSQRYK